MKWDSIGMIVMQSIPNNGLKSGTSPSVGHLCRSFCTIMKVGVHVRSDPRALRIRRVALRKCSNLLARVAPPPYPFCSAHCELQQQVGNVIFLLSLFLPPSLPFLFLSLPPSFLCSLSHLALSLFISLSFSLSLSVCCFRSPSRMGRGDGPGWQEPWKIWQEPLFPSRSVSPPSLCVIIDLQKGHIQDEKQVSQEKCESLYAFSWYQHQLCPPSPPLPYCPSPSLLTLHFCILSFFIVSFALLSLPLPLSVFLPPSLCLPLAPPSPLFLSGLCLLFDLPECVFASVCWSIKRERERMREGEGLSECVLTHAFVRACLRACLLRFLLADRGRGRDRPTEGGR